MPHPRTSLIHLLVPLLVAASLPLPAATAQEAPAPSGEYGETVDVNVVNIEVMVRTKDGQPVLGLTRDDFVVREDGEPVELTNFYAVEDARRVAAAEEAAQPAAGAPPLDALARLGQEEAAPAPPEAPAPLPAEQRLELAVLIDDGNISPNHRKPILDQIRAHVDSVVRPGDRVMVASLQPEIEIHQTLTEDLTAVDAALDRLGRRTSGRADLFAQRRQVENAIDSFDGSLQTGPFPSKDNPDEGADRVLQLIRSYGVQADGVMRRTFASLDDMIDSMSGLEGRKAILLVSENLSPRPAEHLLETWYAQFTPVVSRPLEDPQRIASEWDSTPQMQQVTRHAAANRVVFYTVNAAGTLDSSSNVETARLGPPGLRVDLSSSEPLMQLAAATGGDAMLSSPNAAALMRRMSTDFTDYYSLGYSSPRSQDGKYHHISVEVPGREARVRHTEGYAAKSVDQRLTERTLSSLLFDVGDNPLDIKVQLGKEQPEKKNFVVPVLVRVPISRLVLVPEEKIHRGKMTLYLAVRDTRGRVSAPQRVEVPVEIPNDQLLQAMGKEVGQGVNLLVRPGESKLAVTVRDDYAAVTSTLNLNISIGNG